MTRTLHVVTSGQLPATFPANDFQGQATFQSAQTDEELRSAVLSADVLFTWQIPAVVPDRTPRLHWIQLASAGADHVIGSPAWDSEITITASTGIHAIPMAEHLFSMTLALSRHVPSLVQAQEHREWLHDRRGSSHRFSELRGKTLGIVGWGQIGDAVAHLGRAFGMRIVGTRWSVVVPREVPRGDVTGFEGPIWLEQVDAGPDIVYPAAQLHEVLAQSDVIAVLLPLTAHTRGLLGRGEFASMKRGALFLNIGRGAVVDQEALVEALASSRLGGAGLDVFESEPLPKSSPLWSMRNVIVSPHVGGMSDHTRDRTARLFAVNLARYIEGQPLLNIVDRRLEY